MLQVLWSSAKIHCPDFSKMGIKPKPRAQEAAGLAEPGAGFVPPANPLQLRARFPKLNRNESKRGNPRAVIVVCLFCFTAGTSGVWAGCAMVQGDGTMALGLQTDGRTDILSGLPLCWQGVAGLSLAPCVSPTLPCPPLPGLAALSLTLSRQSCRDLAPLGWSSRLAGWWQRDMKHHHAWGWRALRGC